MRFARALVVAGAVLMFIPAVAEAQESCTWSGATSTNWFTPTNWSCVGGPPEGAPGVPDTANESAMIFTPTPNSPVLTTDVNLANLTFGSPASLTINSGVTLNVASNYSQSGDLVGGGRLGLVSNAVGTWGSGVAGPGQTFINNSARLTANGGPLTVDGRTFSNFGQMNVNATLVLDGGALIDINSAGALLSLTGDVSILPGTGGSITNSGVLRKSVGTGTSEIGVPYTSLINGVRSTDSDTGTLEFTAGGSLAGDIELLGNVLFSAGTYNWTFNGAFGGAFGTLIVDGATINYANASNQINIANLELVSGSMASNGPTLLSLTNFIWSGGTLAGTNSVTQTNGAIFTTGPRILSSQTLQTNCCSTTAWSSGNFVLMNGARIENNTTWSVTGSGAFTFGSGAPVLFKNFGNFQRLGGGTTTIGPNFEYEDFSFTTVDGTLQIDGIYDQMGGMIAGTGVINTPSAPLTIKGGTLGGNLTINGNVVIGDPGRGGNITGGNFGTTGTLQINGSYTQTVDGTFNVDVFGTIPGSQYDRILVSGPAMIAGNLNTNRGGFTPMGTDPPYDILVSMVSRTGTFSSAFTPGFMVDYSDPMKVALIAAPGPDLFIDVRDVQDPIAAGTTFTVSVDVFNIGTVNSTTPATITIDVPDNASILSVFPFGSASPTCNTPQPTSPELTCTTSVALLANSGNSALIQISLQAPSTAGTLTTTANVTAGTDPEVNPANNTDTETTTVVAPLTLNVTTTNDEIDLTPCDGICNSASGCSLRAAIEESNCSDITRDVINVPPGTYVLTRTGSGEDLNQTGDLDITDGVDIIGASAKTTFIDGAGSDRIFDMMITDSCGDTLVDIQHLTIRNGAAPGGEKGGGARLTNSSEGRFSYAEIANNMAPEGGGVFSATYFGCSLRSPKQDPSRLLRPAEDGIPAAQVRFANTAFLNNSATAGSGGGILVGNGSVSTENTTFSMNSATANGGAVAVPLAFDNYRADFTTFSQNTATTGGGIFAGSSAFPNIYHSIVANNTNGDCAGAGGFTSRGYNINQDGTCGFTNTGDLVADPLLAPLTNLGSETSYYGLLQGSPAIDAGDPAITSGVDQRNLPRPRDGDGNGSVIVDIGAIETQPEANLSITKTGPGTVTAGGSITYTISVTNGGPNAADPVTVNDTISTGAFVSATAPCSGGFPCNVGPLAVGQTVMFDATFSIPGTATGSVTNTATVTSPPTDFDATNNTASQVSTIISSADLSVTKTGPSFVTAGQNVTYTTTVTNGGPSAATNVVVSDPTPAGLTFISNSGACSTAFPCNVGTLVSGGNAVITTTYLVSPSATGTITNTASATSDASDPNTANNSGTIVSSVTASGDLSIVKNGPTSVIAGQNITYTIDVINPGPSDATAVMVADPTPAGTTFVSNSGACTTAFPCILGTLTPGQTASITATFKVSTAASGSIVNTATVSSATGDSNTANNSSSTSAVVVSQADLSINKTGPASASNGDTIVYTITVSNGGPSGADNVTINDPTPAGLTFVSNSGDCTTAYPCVVGTMAAGQVTTIQSTYTVSAGASGSITNTASVTTTTNETSTSNNSSSATTNVGGCPQAAPVTLFPTDGAEGVALSGTLSWSDSGASQYNLFFGPAGSGCSTLVFSGSATSQQYFNLTPGQQYEYRVEGARPGCTTLSSACATFRAMSVVTCPAPPTLLSPISGLASSPVPFTWTAVDGATSYALIVNGNQVGTTSETTLMINIPSGPLTWSVIATVPGCGPLQSQSATLNICNIPARPLPSVVGEAATGQSYRFQWSVVPETVRYEAQESLDPEFDSVNDMFVLTGNFLDFEKNIDNPPLGFYYRVRAIGACGELPGEYSEIVRVVIVPIPANPNVSIPAGSTEVVVQTVFITGDEGITSMFTATTDKPWLTVRPGSGLLPPEGITVEIVADPSMLPNGTITGTIILELIAVSNVRTQSGLPPAPTQGSTTSRKKQVPVSISLVTPITPSPRTTPTSDSLIIPTVGHLDGINSRFQSDVRITNTSLQKLRYQVSFNQAGQDPGRPIKQTLLDIEGDSTLALDDIVKNFFGIGGLGDQAAGFIEFRPFGGSRSLSPEVDQAGIPRASRVTIGSSRTYNIASNGTLGQFIPALSFSGFITRTGGAFAQVLSLQQISQNSAFRSNIGLVEASGNPVSVLMSIFNSAGNKLLDIPVDLRGGESRQFNGLLAQNGITLADGRVETRVLSGDGRVTAYASVIENSTNDPLLVSGVALGQVKARRFVFPGAGSLNSAAGRFRTDMRLFNSGAPQTATLTFYPQSGPTVSRELTLNSGEVRVLDDVVGSLFGAQGAGAVHVETPTEAELIVSGRTYAETARGRIGQFIEAVTPDEAVGRDERTLHILQVEDSPRYRTNIGVAEVTGKPAMVEILVHLPDSKVRPRVVIPMAANEFRQFPLLRQLGLGNVYNARVTVRVMEGEGRVTAYGSVIDETSQDPTYIKAQ